MKPRDEWHLDTKHIGRRVLVFDRVDSTNSLAAAMAGESVNDGLVILADEQTVGRGQPGRRWCCPPGDGILMSVLVFPPPPLQRAPVLTAWAAVSVCQTIQELTGLDARIKWPNDVLVQGHKVCGILVEKGATYAVVGIGLNVRQSSESFMTAGLPHAASLAMFFNGPLDRRDIARRLLQQLDAQFNNLNALEERWKSRLGLVGQVVTIGCLDGTLNGRLRDVTFDAVTLELSNGTLVPIPPELLRNLTAAVVY